MLVHPSSVDLSIRTLQFLTGRLKAGRQEIGTRWRRLPAARQALLALAHLRCGDTHAQLAAGFGIGIATVYSSVREAVDVLPLAPSPAEVMWTIQEKTFVILDGTPLPINHITADTPYCSGKHKRHGKCRDSTGSSKPSPKRCSDAGRTRHIGAPAAPSAYRFGVGGWKIHLITERTGLPVSVAISAAANLHDASP